MPQLASGTASSSPSRSPSPSRLPRREPIGRLISSQAGCRPTMLPIRRGWITWSTTWPTVIAAASTSKPWRGFCSASSRLTSTIVRALA